eukprot:scaffold49_cov409-Prasinococcus_capsulatus_cf.AAC.43
MVAKAERTHQHAIGTALAALGQQQQQALFGLHDELSKKLQQGRSLCGGAFRRKAAQARRAGGLSNGFIVSVRRYEVERIRLLTSAVLLWLIALKVRGSEAKQGTVLHVTRSGAFAAIIPGDSAAEYVVTSGIFNFLNIYNSLLIGRLILTWFPNPPQAIVSPLATLCDPYLNLFRGKWARPSRYRCCCTTGQRGTGVTLTPSLTLGIIPPLGGTLDFSPILAFITLNFFTSSAAALPCEVRST